MLIYFLGFIDDFKHIFSDRYSILQCLHLLVKFKAILYNKLNFRGPDVMSWRSD